MKNIPHWKFLRVVITQALKSWAIGETIFPWNRFIGFEPEFPADLRKMGKLVLCWTGCCTLFDLTPTLATIGGQARAGNFTAVLTQNVVSGWNKLSDCSKQSDSSKRDHHHQEGIARWGDKIKRSSLLYHTFSSGRRLDESATRWGLASFRTWRSTNLRFVES